MINNQRYIIPKSVPFEAIRSIESSEMYIILHAYVYCNGFRLGTTKTTLLVAKIRKVHIKQTYIHTRLNEMRNIHRTF